VVRSERAHVSPFHARSHGRHGLRGARQSRRAGRWLDDHPARARSLRPDDALPADANSTALGSSLQAKLLNDIPGLTLDSIKVDPVVGVETEEESADSVVDASSTSSARDSVENSINFSLTVSTVASNPDALREVLLRLERSIRAIDVRSLSITTQSARLTLTASGIAFYEPAKKVELRDKVVRP